MQKNAIQGRNVEPPRLYGCLTGFTLPVEDFEITPGIWLRRTFVDTFGGWHMGFTAPNAPHVPHPAPWAPVSGSNSANFRAQVEIVISQPLGGFELPEATAAFVASILRLRIDAPIRLVVVANMPFDAMAERWSEVKATAFETSSHQWGIFRSESMQIGIADLVWLKKVLPVAASLYQDERFQRAFSIYDEALWSVRKEVVTMLIWTAIEIFFDVSAEQNKTRAISDAVSDWIGHDKADRDRAYNVIRDLYIKRGRVVHVGRQVEDDDFVQSLSICRAVFGNAIGRNELPPARVRIAQ